MGRTLRLNLASPPVVIIGVALNAFYNGYRRDADPNVVFVAASTTPSSAQEMTLYVRYTGRRESIVPAISQTLHDVNDRLPIVYLRSVDEQLAGLIVGRYMRWPSCWRCLRWGRR